MSKQSDRGAKAPTALDTPALAEAWQSHRGANSAGEAVYLTLREAIGGGKLRPGDVLTEPAIAEALGISRTPIREALLRLETEALVERGFGRRLVVCDITPEEILDVYAVREVLNGLAARLAAENATTADLVRLRRLHRELRWAFEEGDSERMAQVNFQFHDAICAASRNAFLLSLLRKAHETHHRYPGTTFSHPDRAGESVHEHEQLLDAIEQRDGERAAGLAQEHIAGVRRTRVAMLDGSLEEERREAKTRGEDSA